MSRAAKIALAVVVLVAASPVWGFEVLYRVFLPANRPELPATTDATPFEMDALWLESGERLATSPDGQRALGAELLPRLQARRGPAPWGTRCVAHREALGRASKTSRRPRISSAARAIGGSGDGVVEPDGNGRCAQARARRAGVLRTRRLRHQGGPKGVLRVLGVRADHGTGGVPCRASAEP